MPAVLLAGAFGQRNPGDDALLAAFARALPEWHILATARGRDSSGLPGVSIVPVDSPATIARAIAASDAVVFAGGLYRINPLDQPGVEESKRLTYGQVGRKGFEAERAEVEQWLARKRSDYIL